MFIEDMIHCEVCEPECPIGALAQGEDIYIIGLENALHAESHEQLRAKFESLMKV